MRLAANCSLFVFGIVLEINLCHLNETSRYFFIATIYNSLASNRRA